MLRYFVYAQQCWTLISASILCRIALYWSTSNIYQQLYKIYYDKLITLLGYLSQSFTFMWNKSRMGTRTCPKSWNEEANRNYWVGSIFKPILELPHPKINGYFGLGTLNCGCKWHHVIAISGKLETLHLQAGPNLIRTHLCWISFENWKFKQFGKFWGFSLFCLNLRCSNKDFFGREHF